MSHFSMRLAKGVVAALALCAAAVPALATPWDEIRNSVYGDRKIEDGRGIVTMTAPGRPEDMRAVPIAVAATLPDGRSIKSVSVIIDENPTPVVAVYNFGGERNAVSLRTLFRVNSQSDIRALVETNDGAIYMVSQLVKFAGGQSSCSAPPEGDPMEIARNMGKMALDPVAAEHGASSSALAHVKLKLSHPNHTGMVMNQQTLLYTPMKMVSEILVRQGGEDVLRVEGSIALSQDPQIEFDLKRTGATELEVTLKDTDNGTWTQMLPIGPQS